jgi:hypothetical protein
MVAILSKVINFCNQFSVIKLQEIAKNTCDKIIAQIFRPKLRIHIHFEVRKQVLRNLTIKIT